MSEFWEDPGYREWEQQIKERMIPMLKGSAATISLIPRGELDVKFAVELGLAIMLDTPIIALVQPGMSIPNGLAAVAAEIVEVDISRDPDAAQRSIAEAFARVAHTDERHISLDDSDD